MDAAKSIISFSEDKLKWMEQQLNNADNGYWWQDIWDSESNPYNVDETHRLSHRKSLYFNKINNCCLKTEMKFAYWQQLVQGKWNMGTLYGGGPYKGQKQFAEFFNQQKCQSLLDKSLEDWLIILRTFLIDKDYYCPRKTKGFLNQGETKKYLGDDPRLFILRRIYKTIESVYDEREEWEKDSWIFENLGLKPKACEQKSLSFANISQPWLREATKKFCKYELVTKNLQLKTVMSTVSALKNFSRYLSEVHPYISPSQITRSLFEDYLVHLFETHPQNNYRASTITRLNIFLTTNELHQWIDIPQRLIYPDDYPKRNKYETINKSKIIPDVVIEQLLQSISELPLYQRRMLIILANGGMRIGELIELSFNCLTSNGSGGYLLRYYQPKLKEPITKPIASIFHDTQEVIATIRDQQEEVIRKFGHQCPYLFPSPRSRIDNIKPVAYATLHRSLKKVVCEHKIRDENGKLWNFHAHQFRHTAGTKLANDDEVGLFGTKTYLGHQSIDMTLHYAKMDERKLQQKIERFNANNQVIDYTGKTVNLSKDERFKEYWNYLKQGDLLKAQMMEHGICTLPAMLSPCPHKHKCLSCTHFVTTPDHLPFHINEYKVQLARLSAAEARGMKRSIEDYKNVLEQLEKIIVNCGGDLESIKANINNNESNLDLQAAQIQQLMTKMGLSSLEELKQVIALVGEADNA